MLFLSLNSYRNRAVQPYSVGAYECAAHLLKPLASLDQINRIENSVRDEFLLFFLNYGLSEDKYLKGHKALQLN